MAADNHYFSESPSTPSSPGTIEVAVRGLELELVTDRATFSPHRLDPGTRFLLERAPDPPPAGRFLDLGCGYGPMTVVLSTLSPQAEVWAVDTNQRARDLCRQNADRLGLSNVTVSAPDDCGVDRFDLIWSNPPIRIGKAGLHDLLERWLGLLSPGGRAVVVVNRHLGADSLHRWLDEQGFATERLASRRGYRLLASAARVSDPRGVDGQA